MLSTPHARFSRPARPSHSGSAARSIGTELSPNGSGYPLSQRQGRIRFHRRWYRVSFMEVRAVSSITTNAASGSERHGELSRFPTSRFAARGRGRQILGHPTDLREIRIQRRPVVEYRAIPMRHDSSNIRATAARHSDGSDHCPDAAASRCRIDKRARDCGRVREDGD